VSNRLWSTLITQPRVDHMKWLIQTLGADPAQPGPEPRALAEMIQQMRDIDDELRASGEMVLEQGLTFRPTLVSLRTKCVKVPTPIQHIRFKVYGSSTCQMKTGRSRLHVKSVASRSGRR
jgi:hypothetical protein